MNADSTRKINPPLAILLGLQLIFIIVLATSLHQVLSPTQSTPEVEVSGLRQEIPGLPESAKERINYYLYRAIARNSSGESISEKGANIREGSLINDYYETSNVHYVNFIADIPDVQQSYQVSYEWSDDEANQYISPDYSAVVTCLDKDQLIYGDFNCNRDQDYMVRIVVGSMIRAADYKIEGIKDLKLTLESYNKPDDFKVKLSYEEDSVDSFCEVVSAQDRQIALDGFEDFVRKLGYKPSSIPYYFYNCEDEFYKRDKTKGI